ncbi:MAG: carboxypeptidase regulatory-like domain-containing protein [Vicinamibacterales bacterium]
MFSRRLAVAAVFLGAALGNWQLAGTAQVALAVSGVVAVSGQGAGFTDRSDVVVWLSPVGDTARPRMPQGRRFRIDQQNKRFQPHVLVVPVGSAVDFPNLDPVFHNVFSLFDGKRFDLGLYEAGTTRGVNLTRAGVCYVFCNIHPEMSAVVVAVDSPYYATSAANGSFAIADVPPGRYRLSVWHERFRPEDATEFPKDVSLSPGAATLAPIRLVSAGRVPTPHTNKFGHEYTPPSPASPAYP